MNRLSKEKSPYLQHASHQKIDWYSWSEKPFARARAEGKPIFMSSGAIWCHWCHVMAKECFYDEEIVNLLNEKFICIKLDRDEMPDIDRRYQMANSAMGYGGGWPLSIFMTHEKKPFFGGTYFPPDDKWGKPGFRKVLKTVYDFYINKQDEVTRYSDNLLDTLKYVSTPTSELNEDMLYDALTAISGQFDKENGGFGSSPKFPMPGAIELLLSSYYFKEDRVLGDFIKQTMNSMVMGGFHDHLGGGFHRYSVDEAWIVPHFEKMADDNAWLLRNYVDAYAVFGEEIFKEAAHGVIRFFMEVLSEEGGCFYASQGADVNPDDEGGYFTWTREDFSRALNSDELRIMEYFLGERGSMHHDNSKRVIFASLGIHEIADQIGMDVHKVQETIKIGKKKLLAERDRRQPPIIDKTLYTSLNGMVIGSFLKAFRVLNDSSLKDFALKSLKRIMSLRFINGELFHSEGVRALLDDYIYLVEAHIYAYEASSDAAYLKTAEDLMDFCIVRLWDDAGGFFDTDKEIIGVKIKAVEDIPHPSSNSMAIGLLLKLAFLTNKELYKEMAEKSLRVFCSRAQSIGVHAGGYFKAMHAYFNQLNITLSVNPQSEFAHEVLHSYHPHMCLSYSDDKGFITPCLKTFCFEPISRKGDFKAFLSNLRK